jgi:hypothetical protein
MSVPCKFERSLLSHEDVIRLSHHPAGRISLRPCDPACTRCTIRSKRSADRNGFGGAGGDRLPGRNRRGDETLLVTYPADLGSIS